MEKKLSRTKSFRARLTKDFLIVDVILILLLSEIFLIRSIVENKNEITNSMVRSAESLSEQFSYNVKNMTFISSYILSDKDFLNACSGLSAPDLSAGRALECYRAIQSPLVNYSVVSSTYTVSFFNRQGYIAVSHNYNLDYSFSSRLTKNEWERMPWLGQVSGILGRAVLLPVQKKPFELDQRKALMLVREVRNPGDGLGYLIVDISADDLKKTMTPNMGNDAYVVVENNGTIMYSSDNTPQEILEAKSRNEEELRKIGYLSCSVIKDGYQCSVISSKYLMWYRVAQNTVLLLLMSAAVIAAAVLLIYYLSRKYTRSIEKLTQQISQTNLGEIYNSEEKDEAKEAAYSDYSEISYLYSAFNHMENRINKMVNKEIAWKTRQIQQRFTVLQSQINPHFIYNTLNTIGLLGLETNNQNVFDACRNLSNLLRYSIVDKNGSLSTIGEEIDNIRDYLEIMKLRFEDGCTYSISECEDVSAIKIPRVSLQPFVENAFEYAMVGGRITVGIETSKVRDGCEINIRDHGPGMTEDMIQRLNEEIAREVQKSYSMEPEITHKSMGIINTLTRLSLYYGDRFRYSIVNENPGLRITLTIMNEDS